MKTSVTFCTICAQNYLPQALVMARSLSAHNPGIELIILVLDAESLSKYQSHFPATVRLVGPTDIIPRDTFFRMALMYDLVELATAVKPALLRDALKRSPYAVYLDPDLFVVSPLDELDSELAASGGVLLTPHFLDPIPPGDAYISETHSLSVGVYNLGFCGVTTEADGFLSWWWSHLQSECLIYPLFNIFVDQKWVDVGSVLFPSRPLRHYGYNVGPWNLHERQFGGTASSITVGSCADSLRIFHFSGFDHTDPSELSSRLNTSTAFILENNFLLQHLCQTYGREISCASSALGPLPTYTFARDANGKRLSKRTRRLARAALLRGETVPLPFANGVAADAFRRWTTRRLPSMTAQTVGNLAVALKYALPDEYEFVKHAFPPTFRRLRSSLLKVNDVHR